MKKITKATFKSFIKKNEGKLFIQCVSSFDGIFDGVEYVHDTLGYNGIWLVGGSRDYFTAFDNGDFTGYEVYNCCGSFIIATQKQQAAE